MVSRRECEFFLLRYVPDPVRNEFVHVGVILRLAGGLGGGAGAPALRFTSDWRRVRCLDPDADTAMLEGLESELRRRLTEEPGGNLFHVLEDSFSNSVQMTTGKAYLAESIESGVEELMRLYVEPLKRERVARLSGRAGIQAQMRGEFERAGVWDLLRKKIRAAEFTRAGDPLRIDLGYRVEAAPRAREARAGAGTGGAGEQADGVIRMFHAVSLEGFGAGSGLGRGSGAGSGIEAAKGLAVSAAGLIAGVRRVEHAELELTAIIEPASRVAGIADGGRQNAPERSLEGWDGTTFDRRPVEGREEFDPERLAAYRFAVETMEEHRIRVLTTADLARVAGTARVELRV